MLNQILKDQVVRRLLPRVQTPGQYLGGELHAIRKDHRTLRGKLCLAFPDTYAIGMSNHGMQVLYAAVNRRDDWACERAYAPWPDMEALLRAENLPLYSLETFTPLDQFDVLGFTLQHDLCYSNVLTILDLGRIPLAAEERTLEMPLVIAGGPCVQNPEPMARFIDVFVIGDGEESLPAVCDAWLDLKHSGLSRGEAIRQLAARLPFVYVPACYEPQYVDGGRAGAPVAREPGIGPVRPAVVQDLDVLPLPVRPIVPNIECVHDRIAIEIMRGCPWHCRFCQATTIKRPLRFRTVDTIVEAAVETYRNTGYNEISLLSLSTSDYPRFEELMRRLQAEFRPLGVSIAVPSLRVNEQLETVGELMNTDRHSGLTLAPEVARDEMRRQIGKRITNEDLLAGCRKAFENGFQQVKLYFMCGLPGEQPADLDGIIDLAEDISRLGRSVHGRLVQVVANVSNFVPKPHTPYQWNAMPPREYFREARTRLYDRRRLRTVTIKCHDIDTSLLEGIFCRGDRRLGATIEAAWRAGARFDSWSDQFNKRLWWDTIRAQQVDVDAIIHRPYALNESLPWDPITIRQGRGYLEREQQRAAAMHCATDVGDG
ncbi:MAG: TIGR03960 family B12-binding radical SAM protein [Thermoguttaceae bacterium]